jgi:hypothetical protein
MNHQWEVTEVTHCHHCPAIVKLGMSSLPQLSQTQQSGRSRWKILYSGYMSRLRTHQQHKFETEARDQATHTFGDSSALNILFQRRQFEPCPIDVQQARVWKTKWWNMPTVAIDMPTTSETQTQKKNFQSIGQFTHPKNQIDFHHSQPL